MRNWIEKINRKENDIEREIDENNREEKQSEEDREEKKEAGQETERFAEPRTPAERKRRERSDKGRVLITARDEAVLRWIGEQYAVRIDQLQVLLGRQAQARTETAGTVSEGTARRVAGRWAKAGWVVRRKVFHREPEWIWLTPSGMRLAGLEYRALEPSVVLLKHTYEVNRVRLRVESLYGEGAVWRSERAIKPIRQRNRDVHYADAEIEIRGRTIGLEIERTAKKPIVLRTILAGLVREYPGVWYLVAPAALSGVQRAVRALPDEQRRRVKLYDLITISEIAP